MNMIGDTLNRTGLGHIWLLDGSLHNYIKDRLQLRLNYIFKHDWVATTCSNPVCTNYTVGLFKETLELEEYLINLDFKYMKPASLDVVLIIFQLKLKCGQYPAIHTS